MGRFGPVVKDIAAGSDGATLAIPLAGHSTTVYSKSFPFNFGVEFGVWVKGTGSAPKFDVNLEESWCDVAAGNENAADGNFVIPEGASAVFNNIEDSNAHVAALSPVVAKFGRFKITSDASNGADTTISIKLMEQEEM